MATIGNSSSRTAGTNTNSHTGTITLGSASRRKVEVNIAMESSAISVTGVTVNGQNATVVGTSPYIHPSDTQQRLSKWYYDVPSGVPAGTVDIVVTTGSSMSALSWHASEIVGAADGAPTETNYGSAIDTNNATATVTASAGDALIGVGMLAAATQTITVGGSVTQIAQLDEPSFTSASGGASDVAAGSRTMVIDPSGSTNSSVLLSRYATASAAALVIDTQPANSWNGETIRPAVVVRMTTDGTTTDTGFTGNVVATRQEGTGTLGGTTTVAAVAGVATFSTLAITGSGAHRLRFTGNSLTVDSNIFNVATGTGVPGGGSTYEEADMQQETFARGATSKTVELIVKNTDGSRATGLAHTALSCWRSIDGGEPVQVTLSAGTVGTYASGSWAELSAANKPGKYAFGLPTLPTSGDSIVFTFTGTGLQPSELRVTLTADDPRAASETREGIATEVREAIDAAPVAANTVQTNGVALKGDGTEGNKFRSTLVP